jgi:glycosidase
MPDFNLRNQAVVDFHLNNLRYWLNMGVDGFRFDAVGVLFEAADGSVTINHPDNHPLLAQVRAVVEGYDNRYMVCEAPDGPTLYATDASCGKAFAFGVQDAILQSAVSGLLHNDVYNYLNQSARDRMPLILSNHDHFAGDRPMSYMLSQAGITTSNVDGYLKTAASVYILLSATPFTYYGEEVGQTGAGGDWDLRRPMSWVDDATTAGFTTGVPFRPPVDNVLTNNVQTMSAVSGSLLAHYQALFQVRERYPVLAMGDLTTLSNRGDSVLAFAREFNGQRAVVLVNLSIQTRIKQLAKSQGFTYADVLQAYAVTIDQSAADVISVSLPPQAATVIVGQ